MKQILFIFFLGFVTKYSSQNIFKMNIDSVIFEIKKNEMRDYGDFVITNNSSKYIALIDTIFFNRINFSTDSILVINYGFNDLVNSNPHWLNGCFNVILVEPKKNISMQIKKIRNYQKIYVSVDYASFSSKQETLIKTKVYLKHIHSFSTNINTSTW